jgi:hypothetical protein
MPTNLTTLTRVRQYWRTNVPSASVDTLLQRLIDEVSDAICRYCDRDFVLQEYKEWYLPESDQISLRQYPIDAVFYCGYGITAAAILRYVGSVRFCSVTANRDEVITTVMDTGTPLVKRYPTTGKSVDVLCAEIAADSTNPNWMHNTMGDFGAQPAFMIYPFNSWDGKVGAMLNVPALPVSFYQPQNSERTIESQYANGQKIFVWYKAGYTMPDESTDGTLPPALMHLTERCVVEAYQTSVDYQMNKKGTPSNVVNDWIITHAREFTTFRRLSV